MIDVVYVGIDDGHDGIKVYFGAADSVSEPVKAQIPSKLQTGIGDAVEVSESKLNDMTIQIDPKDGADNEPVRYLVDGDYVTDKIETRVDSYPYSDFNLALIHQAIRTLRPQLGTTSKLKIVAGLPANQYYNKSAGGKNDELIKKKVDSLKTLDRAHSPADKDLPNEGRFEAVEVVIMPEGYGIAFNMMFDDELGQTEYYERFKSYGCVVVDIGGRTVDVVTVLPRSCKPKGSALLSFDRGVLYLRETIAASLTEKYKLKNSLNENSIDLILRTGWIGIKGSKQGIDVNEDLKTIKKKHAVEIYKSIKGVLDTNEALGGVILSGGGAVLLGDALKEYIEAQDHQCEVINSDEEVFANAKGFWKLAWAKFQ